LRSTLTAALHALASLRLTVPLLAISVAIVFVGTIAQTTWDEGLWYVEKNYFHSFIGWLPPFQIWGLHVPALPFPGGFAVGTVLMANLLAAHAVRFQISWKRAGILFIHSGVVILLANE